MIKRDKFFEFYKYSVLSFLMFVSAINFNVLINPGHIVSGGTNGVSIILENFINIDASFLILIISLCFLFIAFLFKEYNLVLSSLLASLIYPLFVKLTSNMCGIIDIASTSMIIISIFSGFVSGLISGTVSRFGMSQGGIFLIAQIIGEKLKISVSKVNFFLNCLIVLLGGFIFGFVSIMYAVIFLVTNKIAIDKVTLGTSSKKLFQIITSRPEEVENYIKYEINSGYTIFNAKGTTPSYENKKQIVIMASIYTIDYFKLKEGIKRIDDNAFILITDSYQSKGGN